MAMAWSSALKNHGHKMYWMLAKAKFKLFHIFIPALPMYFQVEKSRHSHDKRL